MITMEFYKNKITVEDMEEIYSTFNGLYQVEYTQEKIIITLEQ